MNAASSQPASQETLNAAFAALKAYQAGSPRGALMAIDDAVSRASRSPQERLEMERRVMAVLVDAGYPTAAREYACSKLKLIGSKHSVAGLEKLLSAPELFDAARNALESIPGAEASAALRKSLRQLSGRQKAGVIHSLGTRRDESSIATLRAMLNDANPEVAGAAAGALGAIGTTKSASALRAFLKKAPAHLKSQVADAMLACAERLIRAGKHKDARALYLAISDSPQPAHIRKAAELGLTHIAG
jgi:HEAT repeat protein